MKNLRTANFVSTKIVFSSRCLCSFGLVYFISLKIHYEEKMRKTPEPLIEINDQFRFRKVWLVSLPDICMRYIIGIAMESHKKSSLFSVRYKGLAIKKKDFF